MKKIISFYFLLLAAVFGFTACDSDDPTDVVPQGNPKAESLIFCDEGTWQSDDGQLSFYDGTTGMLTNDWFKQKNSKKLGDTPNDIIQVNDTLLAVCVNWSNIIQYIRPDGTACGATEDVPNNRHMATDGRYLYVTSYAHECNGKKFTKGFVAKIDVSTKKVVGTCEVGWEPDGIALYGGKLYVANSGGYSFQEHHDYESTVTVVNAGNMSTVKTIDTGRANLFGHVAQAGQYVLIPAAGNYVDKPAGTVVLNCATDEVKTYDFPATYNTSDGEKFYIIGSQYSSGGSSTWFYKTLDPKTGTVTEGIYGDAVTSKIKNLKSPYDIYVSPYTHNLYVTDSRIYGTAGKLYGFTRDGESVINGLDTYIGPAHMVALPPRR